jgi:hypothetical protein
MTLKLLFTVNAVVGALFGLGFFLVPASVLAPYGITADAVATVLGRLLGAAYLGYAAVSWLMRDAPDSPARRAIVLAFVISYAAGLVAAVLGQLGGAVNALGWSTVAIFALYTLGYGYFQFMKPSG